MKDSHGSTVVPHIPCIPVAWARQWGVCFFEKAQGHAVFYSRGRWPEAVLHRLIQQYYEGAIAVETVAEDVFEDLWAERYGVGGGLDSSDDSDDKNFSLSSSLQLLDAYDEGSGAAHLLNEILQHARRCRATDIHLESRPQGRLAVRMRVDGWLQPMPVADPIHHLRHALFARLKVLAHLNLAETRRFQDGRFRHQWSPGTSGSQDCRVSIVPGRLGENAVIRLLPSKGVPELEDLGFLKPQYDVICSFLKRPQGLILVCGPTGSGKTTTMHAILKRIATQGKKVVTIEDPVEYIFPEAVQIQVQAALGIDFDAALRALLRHDPDIILVGEIRDPQTAATALRTAMTGHFVLSTVHTNDAAGVMERLLDMGVPSYLLASGLSLIIHQRLLRRCCECRQEGAFLATTGKRECPRCHGTGYCGRTAVFESCFLDETAKRDLARGVSPHAIRKRLMARMISLEEAAFIKVREGITDESEVRRCLPVEPRCSSGRRRGFHDDVNASKGSRR